MRLDAGEIKLPLKTEIKSECRVDEYLGVTIEKMCYGMLKIYQPYLTSQILYTLGFYHRNKGKKESKHPQYLERYIIQMQRPKTRTKIGNIQE